MIITIRLLLILILLLLCCGREQPTAEGKRILASFYPMYITVLNIVKNIEGVHVEMLSPPTTGCLHDYQLTPADMVKLEKADVFVINGAGMESFLKSDLKTGKNLTIIDASKKCKLIKDTLEIEHDKSSENHEHGEYNPHVWLSIPRYLQQIEQISSQLAQWDAVHAKEYLDNAKVYSNSVKVLRKELDSLLSQIRYRDIVTTHAAFSYLASDYNLNVRAVLQAEPGMEPSAQQLAEIIEIIKKYSVRAIFIEPENKSKAAQTIARETSVELDTLDPVVTGPIRLDQYVRAMRKNGQTLHDVLSQNK